MPRILAPREVAGSPARARASTASAVTTACPCDTGVARAWRWATSVEQLPAGLTRLVSPFVGGASVEIACANELGMEVTAYDVFDILTNYWQVQLDAPEQLADRIARWQPTKETYASVKQRLKGHWDLSEPIEDPLELAAHYWFNHNLSYGPGFLGLDVSHLRGAGAVPPPAGQGPDLSVPRPER